MNANPNKGGRIKADFSKEPISSVWRLIEQSAYIVACNDNKIPLIDTGNLYVNVCQEYTGNGLIEVQLNLITRNHYE